MKPSRIFRASILLSAGVAALSVSACNKAGDLNGVAANGAPNGAYVQTADVITPTSSGPLSSRGEYRHVAYSPPPPLPEYDQPAIPGPGYMWTPGYWDWSDSADDYYWTPGSWIEPPAPGLFWTPGYWRYNDGAYLFSDGYWGPDVGFYGGVNYGYGYGGDGYYGGRWQGDQFYYNSAANNFGSRRIATVYTQSIASGGARVSYNGGPSGLRIVPNQTQIQAAQSRHVAPTQAQVAQVRAAQAETQLRASVNRGAPAIAATTRPGAFRAAEGVTAARSAPTYTPPPSPARGPQRSTDGRATIAAETSPRGEAVVAPPRHLTDRNTPVATPRAGIVAERPASPAAAFTGPPIAHPRVERAPVERAPIPRPPMERAPVERAAAPHLASPVVRATPQMRAAEPQRAAASAPRVTAAPAAPAPPTPAAERRKPNEH